ncbi:hypothetical protein KC331_g8599 [Hortaea werneckii]|uniref:N-acetyltransferase domain-containing protein n=1 Tax=Hortaea werneckii TaxID=91943 RepID=A0A3M7CLY4_HORWE|nr:hypothetical protein KC331_g8599 [Hortaea werneckii]KAI7712744.1 hypothetical protein KC353_g8052 [Hortaea werneckii]RMY53043.1 hypothetical protein D0865_05462 [Hortaea werneckii]
MDLPPPVLFEPSRHQAIVDQLATIHRDCILQDGTLATFLPDNNGNLDVSKIIKYWSDRSEQVTKGAREIIVQFTDPTQSEVAGFVSLDMPFSETGSFRGMVEKMLVSPHHRYKGVARRVMAELERVAVERGRTVLSLDTVIGSGAELVYPKLGYKLVGVIPKYGIHPTTRELVDEMFFYKDLREVQPLQ